MSYEATRTPIASDVLARYRATATAKQAAEQVLHAEFNDATPCEFMNGLFALTNVDEGYTCMQALQAIASQRRTQDAKNADAFLDIERTLALFVEPSHTGKAYRYVFAETPKSTTILDMFALYRAHVASEIDAQAQLQAAVAQLQPDELLDFPRCAVDLSERAKFNRLAQATAIDRYRLFRDGTRDDDAVDYAVAAAALMDQTRPQLAA